MCAKPANCCESIRQSIQITRDRDAPFPGTLTPDALAFIKNAKNSMLYTHKGIYILKSGYLPASQIRAQTRKCFKINTFVNAGFRRMQGEEIHALWKSSNRGDPRINACRTADTFRPFRFCSFGTRRIHPALKPVRSSPWGHACAGNGVRPHTPESLPHSLPATRSGRPFGRCTPAHPPFPWPRWPFCPR